MPPLFAPRADAFRPLRLRTHAHKARKYRDYFPINQSVSPLLAEKTPISVHGASQQPPRQPTCFRILRLETPPTTLRLPIGESPDASRFIGKCRTFPNIPHTGRLPPCVQRHFSQYCDVLHGFDTHIGFASRARRTKAAGGLFPRLPLYQLPPRDFISPAPGSAPATSWPS